MRMNIDPTLIHETLDLRAEDEINHIKQSQEEVSWTCLRTEDRRKGDIHFKDMSPINTNENRQEDHSGHLENTSQDEEPVPSVINVTQHE